MGISLALPHPNAGQKGRRGPASSAFVYGGTRTREALAVRVHPAHKPQDIHARIRVPGAIDTIQLHRFHCRPPRRYACTAPHRTDLHTAGATLHTQPKRGWPSTPTDATHPDPHIHIAPLAGVVAQRSLCHSRRPHRDAHNRAAAAHIQPHPRGSTSKGTAALSAIQTHKAHLPCEVFVRADKNIADLRTHRSTPASAHAHPPPPYPDDPPEEGEEGRLAKPVTEMSGGEEQRPAPLLARTPAKGKNQLSPASTPSCSSAPGCPPGSQIPAPEVERDRASALPLASFSSRSLHPPRQALPAVHTSTSVSLVPPSLRSSTPAPTTWLIMKKPHLPNNLANRSDISAADDERTDSWTFVELAY
ncbi:hypothetical protein B0H13DRAFT_2345356 [Mycena leptocephala]|nr:hypothetical protein B0H13DRAFT_2345356 [Mycena leptocephala]